MSLGDLNKNVNKSGASAYNARRAEILRQGKEAAERKSAQEVDKLNQEISHMRLQKQTLEGRVMQLKNEITREKDVGMREIREKELHRLQNDKIHLEGEIMTKQGREHAAHNVRYNNPHYF